MDRQNAARDLDALAAETRRRIREAIARWHPEWLTEYERADDLRDRLWRTVTDLVPGFRGSDEALAAAPVVAASALRAYDEAAASPHEPTLSDALEAERPQVVALMEGLVDWHHLARNNLVGRRAIRDLATAGRRDQASTHALAVLRDTLPGDDRAEQDLVRLLDALRLDDAIVDGWDILVQRRRDVHASGSLQYTHAIASWREALERIAADGGVHARAARQRASALVLPDEGW